MMITGMTYLVQVAICLAVFYLFYKILLSKETFYQLNRFLVLALLGLSFVLPIVPWNTLLSSYEVTTPMLNEFAYAATLEELVVGEGGSVQWSVWSVLGGIYLLGMLFVLVGVCVELVKLYRLKRAGVVCQEADGVQVMTLSKSAYGPFSWMSTIYISEEDLAVYSEEIIQHELAHIYYKHSWDILFMNAVLVVQWFNPAAWLLKRELQGIHEYQADDYVIQKGINAQKYQLLLIKKSVGDYLFNLANSFNHSHLTKRITMMLKKKSSRWASLKLMYLLPVLALFAFVFGCSQSESQADSSAKEAEATLDNLQEELVVIGYNKPEPASEKPVEDVFTMVEVMPEFPGGMKELMNYLGSTINYPVEAQKAALEGRVIVQFVVGKDGTISDAEVVRGIDSSLDNEALRVVRSMPKWTPGTQKGKAVNVKYTIPITFRLK